MATHCSIKARRCAGAIAHSCIRHMPATTRDKRNPSALVGTVGQDKSVRNTVLME
jgi:hypothetical protein